MRKRERKERNRGKGKKEELRKNGGIRR